MCILWIGVLFDTKTPVEACWFVCRMCRLSSTQGTTLCHACSFVAVEHIFCDIPFGNMYAVEKENELKWLCIEYIYLLTLPRRIHKRECVHMKKEKDRILFVYLYAQRDPCDRLFMYATICEERWKSQQESRQIMCRASIEIPVNQSIKKETNKERNNKRNWRVEREEMALLIF